MGVCTLSNQTITAAALSGLNGNLSCITSDNVTGQYTLRATDRTPQEFSWNSLLLSLHHEMTDKRQDHFRTIR